MKVHLNAQQPDEEGEGELPLAVMKKYIAYCKRYTKFSEVKNLFFIVHYRKCGPRLSEEAASKLKNRYVMMRNGARQHEHESQRKTTIPITVRYTFFVKLYPSVRLYIVCLL